MAEQYESEVLPFQISIGMRSASSDLCYSALMKHGKRGAEGHGPKSASEQGRRQPCAKALEQG